MNTLSKLAIFVAATLLAGIVTWRPVVAAHLSRAYVYPVTHPALVIHDSGATNLDAARTITVASNGSVSMRYQDGTVLFFTNAALRTPAHSLVSLVQQVGGPQAIRTGQCLESVSFSHTVWLSMAGQQSGDLTCLASSARPIDRQVAHATLTFEQRVIRLAIAQAVV